MARNRLAFGLSSPFRPQDLRVKSAKRSHLSEALTIGLSEALTIGSPKPLDRWHVGTGRCNRRSGTDRCLGMSGQAVRTYRDLRASPSVVIMVMMIMLA